MMKLSLVITALFVISLVHADDGAAYQDVYSGAAWNGHLPSVVWEAIHGPGSRLSGNFWLVFLLGRQKACTDDVVLRSAPNNFGSYAEAFDRWKSGIAGVLCCTLGTQWLQSQTPELRSLASAIEALGRENGCDFSGMRPL